MTSNPARTPLTVAGFPDDSAHYSLYEGKHLIAAINGYNMEGMNHEETAHYIANSVNSHDELVEAAKEALEWFKRGETGATDLPFKSKLKAAIAKASPHAG